MPEPTSAGAAGTWLLGDKTVNRIGFGAMRIAQSGIAFSPDARPADRARSIATLRRAIELGVNHVDTAGFYFSSLRSANELINAALRPYPDDLVIVTKVGPSRDAAGAWGPRAEPSELRGQVEENLRTLGRDVLDVVNFRCQDRTGSIAEHVGALDELRTAGLLRHVGVSGVTSAQLAEARGVTTIVCVQNRFGIDSPTADDALVEECRGAGVAFVPFFSIAREGRHRGLVDDVPDVVAAIARDHGASAAQVLLAWSLAVGPHVLVIPGTASPEHVAENVAAGSLELTGQELRTLAALRAGPGA